MLDKELFKALIFSLPETLRMIIAKIMINAKGIAVIKEILLEIRIKYIA
tara:strand:- start:24 stop:170 length:147 start_codon:yes stop_codon:yes gene_type:complete